MEKYQYPAAIIIHTIIINTILVTLDSWPYFILQEADILKCLTNTQLHCEFHSLRSIAVLMSKL